MTYKKITGKQAFFHEKGEVNNIRIWRSWLDVWEIKGELHNLGAVVDAMYYEETGKVTLYSKRFTKSEIVSRRYIVKKPL